MYRFRKFVEVQFECRSMLSLLRGLENVKEKPRLKKSKPLLAWMVPVTMSESLKQDFLKPASVELCLERGRV